MTHLETSDVLLSTFEVGDISTEALLFQSGYLTIAREKIWVAISC
jgi:hypothetical protein